MVQALQGEVVGSGASVSVGRCRGRSVRHAVPAGQGTYGLRGPSELSWYAFATAYARDHRVGRAEPGRRAATTGQDAAATVKELTDVLVGHHQGWASDDTALLGLRVPPRPDLVHTSSATS